MKSVTQFKGWYSLRGIDAQIPNYWVRIHKNQMPKRKLEVINSTGEDVRTATAPSDNDITSSGEFCVPVVWNVRVNKIRPQYQNYYMNGLKIQIMCMLEELE